MARTSPKRVDDVASERQRYWLRHQRAQEKSGLSTKAYAAAQELPLWGFYAARKRLRAQGLLEPSIRARKQRRPAAKPCTVSFARVAVAPKRSETRFRLELPGGSVLVWTGDDIPVAVVSLLNRWHDAT